MYIGLDRAEKVQREIKRKVQAGGEGRGGEDDVQ